MDFRIKPLFLFLLASLFSWCHAFERDLSYFKAFDDSLLYRLNWEKAPDENLLKNVDGPIETISMVTSRNERYTCSLPRMLENKQVSTFIFLKDFLSKKFMKFSGRSTSL